MQRVSRAQATSEDLEDGERGFFGIDSAGNRIMNTFLFKLSLIATWKIITAFENANV
jgi:hypothetical protein